MAVNWLALGRAGFGAVVLLRPDEVAGHIGDVELSDGTRTAMRILGARLLVESAVCAVRPTRCVIALEVVVDVIHGATMAAVAVVSDSDSRRRAAAANVLTAAAFAVADVAAIKRHQRNAMAEPNVLLGWRDATADRLCRLMRIPGR
ncbi:hypothetical protein BST42_12540 [Mycolicibacterium rhodesiae]|uniref:Uncharacterized protein n=1 Tax=Mycolicibacterium rhodesiae TaxID=36814 RepID=A0A1X0IV84_MYCRH|nr:hypothetical protein BST42_12540 [Mycolicibacterium rhodesiae]